MAAPSLDVDKEQVRMLVMQVGVREAARLMGLNENTVTAWSARGKWLAPVEPVIPKSMQKIATNAIKPAEALANKLAELNGETKLQLAEGLAKGAKAIASMEGEAIVEQASNVKAVTQSAALVHAWQGAGGQGPASLVQIAISGTAPVAVEHMPSAGSGPVEH